MEFTAFKQEDREALRAVFIRVFGAEAAVSRDARWDWFFMQNPSNPNGEPRIWVARDGEQIVGQFATMPVRLSVFGAETDGAWGIDVMITPERQRQGIGESLYKIWDKNSGASIGFGLTEGSYRLLLKLQWPPTGFVPRYGKPLTSGTIRAWKTPGWRWDLLTLAARRVFMRLRGHSRVKLVDQADASFTRLWERLAPQFAFAVRRDAAYLNWKLFSAPHTKYVVGVLTRGDEIDGYVALRHIDDGRRRVTVIVDFLAAPDDPNSLSALLAWADTQAVQNGSAFVRVMSTNGAFLHTLRSRGYHERAPTHLFTGRINALTVPSDYYDSTERWHITLGDADADH